jgi:hypothetical protein
MIERVFSNVIPTARQIYQIVPVLSHPHTHQVTCTPLVVDDEKLQVESKVTNVIEFPGCACEFAVIEHRGTLKTCCSVGSVKL